jgi:hypothetical protein
MSDKDGEEPTDGVRKNLPPLHNIITIDTEEPDVVAAVEERSRPDVKEQNNKKEAVQPILSWMQQEGGCVVDWPTKGFNNGSWGFLIRF